MKNMMIAGNWKMNTTIDQAKELTSDLKSGLHNKELNVKVVVCPPFTHLSHVSEVVKDSNIDLGAQNCYFVEKGAYTGEISCGMLNSVGCKYVIIGHSERRTNFLESDEMVNKKAHTAFEFGLTPIICIGETLKERQKNKTFDIVENQIKKGLANYGSKMGEKLVIAYEPIWAIGTGLAATPEQINEVHNFIRELLLEIFGKPAQHTHILYGGSVTSDNAAQILPLENVNGALVGGASLKANDFLKIIELAQNCIE